MIGLRNVLGENSSSELVKGIDLGEAFVQGEGTMSDSFDLWDKMSYSDKMGSANELFEVQDKLFFYRNGFRFYKSGAREIEKFLSR